MPGIEIRVDPQNNEIMYKGRNTMMGYLKLPQDTLRTLDSEGWIHTGDQGVKDSDGFLKVTGRSNKMLFPPLFIMLCVTFTALVQRLLAMVKAIRTAAAVTIPAGETTWGAVFIANGLQLIIAVLLIILGLTIVVNSLRALNKAEKNSEKAA